MPTIASKSGWISTIGLALTCVSGALLVAFYAPPPSIVRIVRMVRMVRMVRADWFTVQPRAQQQIHHFAAADCRCSELLLNHLLDREPRAGAEEVVVYFGHDNPLLASVKARGYGVRLESALAASGVEAAPWLLVRNAAGRVDYSGGYEPAPFWEARILGDIDNYTLQAARATVGCATSLALRASNPPLGLKELLSRL